MEDDDTSEDTRRVRILSTLESTRQTSRPGRGKGKRREATSKRRGLLQTALWGFMGVGVLALMAGFVMVIQDSKTAPAHTPPSLPITQQAKVDLPKTTALPPTTEAGPAVIETDAVSMTPVVPQATSAAASAALPPVALAKIDVDMARNKPAATATTPPTLLKSAGKPATNASKPQDEDVALLEAMFAHTGRKTPSKPANPQK